MEYKQNNGFLHWILSIERMDLFGLSNAHIEVNVDAQHSQYFKLQAVQENIVYINRIEEVILRHDELFLTLI